jgi:hypothetical protein
VAQGRVHWQSAVVIKVAKFQVTQKLKRLVEGQLAFQEKLCPVESVVMKPGAGSAATRSSY